MNLNADTRGGGGSSKMTGGIAIHVINHTTYINVMETLLKLDTLGRDNDNKLFFKYFILRFGT